jgi:uncharacterized protein YcfL
MKKLFFSLIAMVVLGMVACKKDDSIQPEKSGQSVVSDKRDLATGD